MKCWSGWRVNELEIRWESRFHVSCPIPSTGAIVNDQDQSGVLLG